MSNSLQANEICSNPPCAQRVDWNQFAPSKLRVDKLIITIKGCTDGSVMKHCKHNVELPIFGFGLYRMLTLVQRFGKHRNCHLQGDDEQFSAFDAT
jgi:hypothetical protein